MAENAIIAEIHHHREAVARECGYDAANLVAHYRRLEAQRTDADHPLVSLAKEKVAPDEIREESPRR